MGSVYSQAERARAGKGPALGPADTSPRCICPPAPQSPRVQPLFASHWGSCCGLALILYVAEECPITSASSQFCCPSLSHIVPFCDALCFFGQMVDNEGLFLSQGVDTGVGGEEETPYSFLEPRVPEAPAGDSSFLGAPGPEEPEPFFFLKIYLLC